MMRRIRWDVTVGAFLLAVVVGSVRVAAIATTEPTAVVVQLVGLVQIQRAGQAVPTPAVPGSQLHLGDRLLVPPRGRAVVLYSTDRVDRIYAEVVIEEGPESPAAGLFAATTRSLRQLVSVAAREQQLRGGVRRAAADAARPIAPRNGLTVLETPPRLSWTGVADAEGYTVHLRRADEHCGDPDLAERFAECRPLSFAMGPDTVWPLPAEVAVPGATYEWTVGVSPAGGVAPVAERFRLAGPSDFERAALALQAISSTGLDPADDGLVLVALLFREAGFYYAADRALLRMEALGTAAGRPFFLLRGDVFDAMGEPGLAVEAFLRAEGEPGG